MDKKHLCFRKQPYPEKSAILMPNGYTYGLQAKAIPPSSSQTICRQVRTKMATCVRSIGHRCAFHRSQVCVSSVTGVRFCPHLGHVFNTY